MKHTIFIISLVLFSFEFYSFGQTKEFWYDLRTTDTVSNEKKLVAAEYSESNYCIENQLNAYLDSIADKNRNAKFIRGFRILIYSGNSREEATKAKELAYRSIPNSDVYTGYQSPTFKVKLGDFYQKIEAFMTLKKIKSSFPNAVVMEEVVNLKP